MLSQSPLPDNSEPTTSDNVTMRTSMSLGKSSLPLSLFPYTFCIAFPFFKFREWKEEQWYQWEGKTEAGASSTTLGNHLRVLGVAVLHPISHPRAACLPHPSLWCHWKQDIGLVGPFSDLAESYILRHALLSMQTFLLPCPKESNIYYPSSFEQNGSPCHVVYQVSMSAQDGPESLTQIHYRNSVA